MRSNEHLRNFPIASGNQEKQKVLSIEIDIKFIVIHILLLFWHQTTQSTEAHLRATRSMSSQTKWPTRKILFPDP